MRPIDANALMDNIRKHCIIPGWCYPLIELEINDAPTIEAAPVAHGEWEETHWIKYDGHGECVRYPKQGLRCSNCCHVFKKELLWNDNFCPNCGAKMKAV